MRLASGRNPLRFYHFRIQKGSVFSKTEQCFAQFVQRIGIAPDEVRLGLAPQYSQSRRPQHGAKLLGTTRGYPSACVCLDSLNQV
jgi:hypothetical protein